MNNLLILALIASIKITFIHVVLTWEGMALVGVGRKMERHLHRLLHKPLFSCHICMASIWGIVFWFMDVDHGTFKQFIEFIFIIGGINVLLSCIIGRFQLMNELYGD